MRTMPQEVMSYYTFPSQIIDSWGWVGSNLENEPKLISSSLVTSLYLTVYTSSRPFLATGFSSSKPMSELETRFLITNKLMKVDKNIVRSRLIGDQFSCQDACPKDSNINLNKAPRFLYVNYFDKGHMVLGVNRDAVDQHYNAVDNLIKKYDGLKDVDFKDVKADYVYFGPWEKQFSNPDLQSNKNLDLIYKTESVSLYRINHN